MKICESCGANVQENDVFCKECGSKINHAPPVDTDNRDRPLPASQSLEPNRAAVKPNEMNVALSQGEFRVRTYHCAILGGLLMRVLGANGDGYLTITNKRVIYYGKGDSLLGTSANLSELPIESAGAVSVYQGHGYPVVKIVVTAIVMLGLFYLNGLLGFLVLLYLLLLFLQNDVYTLSIYSSSATGSPIALGTNDQGALGIFSRLSGQSAALTVRATPGRDTQAMMLEVGAVIQDIKAEGDNGAQRWKR